MRPALRITVPVLALLALAATAPAQAKKSDAVVKAEAKADKVGADGTQLVAITLTIDKGWHVYANPVGNEDLGSSQTSATVSSKNKLKGVKVEYPEGKVVKDKTVGDYKTYEGTVTIKATVRRARGDAEPLDVAVKVQACSDSQCLLPATLKLTAK